MLMLDPSTGLINSWLRQRAAFERTQLRHLYLLGHHLGASRRQRHFHQSHVDDAGVPSHGRVDGRGEPHVRRERADDLVRITVPAMTPVIIVVFLLSIIRIFSSFEIELLLGVPWSFYVYSTKIVDLARQEPPLVNQAAALGSVILIFLVAFIPLQRRLIARRQFTTVTGQFKPKIIDLGVWRYPATAFVGFVVLLSWTLCRFLSVFGGSFMTRFGFFNLPKTWTLDYWNMALNDPRILQGLQNTLIVAVSAGIWWARSVFSLIGYVLVRTKLPGRSVLDSICWLPSAIPGRAVRTRSVMDVSRHAFFPALLRHALSLGDRAGAGRNHAIDANSQGELRSVG